YLTPADGYAFTESSTGTVNGKTATATKNNSQLALSYQFNRLIQCIMTVNVKITNPAIGASPDYSPVLGSTSYYSKAFNENNFQNDVRWTDVTSGTTMIPGTSKFQAGHAYRVEIYVTPKDGYVFLDDTTVKLNDKTVSADLHPSSGQLRITYEFPEALTPITSADVIMATPYLGSHPDYYPIAFGPDYSDAHCGDTNITGETYKNGTYWYDITGGEYLALPVATAEFEAEHQYRVIIYLQAEDGYCFADDFVGTINGETAEKSVTSNTCISLSYTFPVLPKAIDSVSINITPPAAGAKPDYNPVLPSGAPYYSDSTDEDVYNHNDVYWEERPNSPMYVASSTFRS
ncbi:MAG: hypothetical protein VZR73_18855, partial [Acutalibacteraceae bacterium]|nr:hypothetical protein [Acutalibacteraceae bacterium]